MGKWVLLEAEQAEIALDSKTIIKDRNKTLCVFEIILYPLYLDDLMVVGKLRFLQRNMAGKNIRQMAYDECQVCSTVFRYAVFNPFKILPAPNRIEILSVTSIPVFLSRESTSDAMNCS